MPYFCMPIHKYCMRPHTHELCIFWMFASPTGAKVMGSVVGQRVRG